MANKLQKMAPAWHADAAQILNENFNKIHAAFTDATKRAVWLGMFLNYIKFRGDKNTGDGSIPHGEFMEWCKKNVPGLNYRSLGRYMRLAYEVAVKGSFQIGQFIQFAGNGQLPPQIEEMVEGKTQQQLFLSFKNTDANGEPLRPGNAPGTRRALTQSEKAEAELELVELRINVIMSDLLGVGPSFVMMPDSDLVVFNQYLMRTVNAINAWLDQPEKKRDTHAIAEMFTKPLPRQ